ncbi:hypothetical protein DSO57_1016484 [Entomophthora muscae]|uniref:Uncharacterized protein n=1 Tax=Entomophthora muscae TaxID=34485 RepID=A0ACC2TFJ0_9FUNG|nr:hypothetical protein DSO57_1016484 [Entomophthora muscae]
MSSAMHPLSRPAFPSKGRASNLKSMASPSPQPKKQPIIQILKRPSDLPKNQAPPNLHNLAIPRPISSPSKPKSSGKATNGSSRRCEPASSPAPDSEATARRRSRPRQRRNSISVSAIPTPPLDLQVKGGHLSDCSVSEVARPVDQSKSLRPPSISISASRVASCPNSKEQAAELLLQSLLQGSHDDHPAAPLSAPVETHEGDLSMASHLLLNLLKPSEFSSTQSSPGISSSKSIRYYAGPMFRKAPEPSALPLPSFLAE